MSFGYAAICDNCEKIRFVHNDNSPYGANPPVDWVSVRYADDIVYSRIFCSKECAVEFLTA